MTPVIVHFGQFHQDATDGQLRACRMDRDEDV